MKLFKYGSSYDARSKIQQKILKTFILQEKDIRTLVRIDIPCEQSDSSICALSHSDS
uniref:Uncharacterized protein n=1 Tax=Arion vulgaris TaxID=1028688 RepID=A0A0B7AJ02_9EUPU